MPIFHKCEDSRRCHSDHITIFRKRCLKLLEVHDEKKKSFEGQMTLWSRYDGAGFQLILSVIKNYNECFFGKQSMNCETTARPFIQLVH